MLRMLGAHEKGARVTATVVTSALPFAIVGGLLYAALFVKAEATVASVTPPPVERRDRFLGVAMPNTHVIWAAGSNGKIIRSDDGGTKWIAQTSNSEENFQGLAAWDESRALAVGGNGILLRTEDGGQHWQSVDAPKSEVANKFLNVRVSGKNAAWIVGEMGAVLRTADDGKTWERALPEKDQAWNDVAFVGNHGLLVGEFGQVMTSDDGGQTWKSRASNVKSSLMSVALRDAHNGVAVGLSGTILVTRDGGEKWTEVEKQTREHLNDVIWDGHQWVVVGDKGVIAYGNADGTQWKTGRVSEGNLGWNTQVIESKVPEGGYLLAGASLARLKDGNFSVLGR